MHRLRENLFFYTLIFMREFITASCKRSNKKGKTNKLIQGPQNQLMRISHVRLLHPPWFLGILVTYTRTTPSFPPPQKSLLEAVEATEPEPRIWPGTMFAGGDANTKVATVDTLTVCERHGWVGLFECRLAVGGRGLVSVKRKPVKCPPSTIIGMRWMKTVLTIWVVIH